MSFVEWTPWTDFRSRKRRQVTTKRKVELFDSFKGQKLSADGVSDRIFEGVIFCELPKSQRS